MRNQPVFVTSVVGAGRRGRPVRPPLPRWRQGLLLLPALVVWLVLAPFAVPATAAAAQAITFTSSPPTPAVFGTTYTPTATGGGSGNPVTFSIAGTDGACQAQPQGDGSTQFLFVQPGTCVIAAHQAGGPNHDAAPTVTQSVDVVRQPQTITFTSTPPANATQGGSYTVTATSTGDVTKHPIRFSVDAGDPPPPPSAPAPTSPAACTMSPGSAVVLFTGGGTCVVAANQAGDAIWAPAPTVTQSFTIAADTRPTAADDSYSTNQDSALSVPAPGVLANDADVEGSPLTAVLRTGPTNGSLSLGGDGAFTYTPNANFSGTDSFTYRASDGTALSAVATVSVTVLDTSSSPPVVTVPGPITVDAPADGSAALVTYSVSATDDNPPSPAVTCTPPSGSSFPIGSTTVNCSATDADGTTGTASFTVTVRDVTPPTVHVPAPITVDADGATGGAPASFTVTASDNDPASGSPPVTCSPPSGSTFPIGTTTVTCTSTDAADNAGTASFTVTVRDILPPVLSLPAPITVDATGDTGGAAVSYSASATDDDPANPNPAVSCSPAPGTTFAIGTTTVSCSSTDGSGNTATGSFTVTVRDVLPPVLTLPANVRVDAVGTTGGAPATYTATSVDDNRAFPNPPVTCTPASGTDFAIGPNTVNCTSTDQSGNVARGSFGVEVVDILAPVLTLPATIAVDATVPEGAVVDFVATAVDDDRRIPTPAVTCTPAPGSMVAVGDTSVTCTATDLYGNTATGSFTIHVQGPAEQLADFVAASQGVGPGNSVASKVEKALSDFAAGKRDKACKSLDDSIKQVEQQTPKKIDPTVAAALIADATRIKRVMACG